MSHGRRPKDRKSAPSLRPTADLDVAPTMVEAPRSTRLQDQTLNACSGAHFSTDRWALRPATGSAVRGNLPVGGVGERRGEKLLEIARLSGKIHLGVSRRVEAEELRRSMQDLLKSVK